MMMRRASGADRIAIGVVGPRDLVERIILLGRDLRGAESPPWRLVGAGYTEEHEAPEKVARLQRTVDVCLFTGPLPHDIVREAGVLEIPATHVSMSGASLYSAMLKRVLTGPVDLVRASIDSLPRAEVTEAYEQIGLDARRVRVREYQGPRSAAAFTDFHRHLFAAGRTSVAFTTVRTVAQRLEAESIPAVRVLPAVSSLRLALGNAALVGNGSRLEDARIAVAVIGLSRRRGRGAREGWREVGLALHQALLREARRMDAIVLPRHETEYLVVATLGSLESATDGFRVAPFMDRAREVAGEAVAVGIGLGHTAHEAESRARKAFEGASGEGQGGCQALWYDGRTMSLPARERGAGPARPESVRSAELLRRLSERLEKRAVASPGPTVVDATVVARVLGVSERTARRMLNVLEADGLAWPMPGTSGSQGGRPRAVYRLLTAGGLGLAAGEGAP